MDNQNFLFRYSDGQNCERTKHQLGFVSQRSAGTETHRNGGEGMLILFNCENKVLKRKGLPSVASSLTVAS